MKYLMLAAALVTTPAAMKDWTPDYSRGFCDGLNTQVTQAREARDRWRAYAGLPKESEKQVLARIYSKPRTGGFAPRRIDQQAGVAEPVSLADSIDLYLVPMHIHGALYVGNLMQGDGHQIQCSGPDDSGEIPKL